MNPVSYEHKETILHVDNLSIAYGDKVIIKDISFEERDVIRKDSPQGQSIHRFGKTKYRQDFNTRLFQRNC
jgi:hypothetical protein